VTGIGEARNNINVLSSQVVFVCGMSAGTAAEVALATKAARPIVLVSPGAATVQFFRAINPDIQIASTPEDAIAIARAILDGDHLPR